MTPADEVTLGAALRSYVEARSAALIAARKTLNIGELDARALLYLVDHPGARPRELIDYLGITSAGVTTLTDRLVERGAIRRDPDDEDRRVVRLSAVVDFEAEPWSVLTRFDVAVLAAIESGEHGDSGSAARLIAELTAAGSAR